MKDLSRLLRPKSIAVIGGGVWCQNLIKQCQKMAFGGAIWPVHPKAKELCGIKTFASLDALPEAPDACFIGVNRFVTIDIVKQLSAMNAGGAICFASGFLEAEKEDAEGAELQKRLVLAAADMPILGPNCYGMINYLDGALLWPDQQGGKHTDTGVAIVTQSSNMAINITMQTRGLPIAYVATAGNQAQTGIAEIGSALLRDDRVTALGLHVEGIGDIRAFEELAATGRALDKPIVVLKVGKSEQAQAATISHTASLAGRDAGAQALLDRLGIARVHGLPEFLETLKLLHVIGPLPSNNIASISCSGGEASLIADSAIGRNVEFPALTDRQKTKLRAALGPMVALANPLDYHTYIWTDTDAMTKTFSAVMDDPVDLTLLVVDFPRADRCLDTDWECAIQAALRSREKSGRPVALVSSLPENLPEHVAERLIAGGVIPLMGLDEALAAAEAAAAIYDPPCFVPAVALGKTPENIHSLSEARAKEKLAAFGLVIPKSLRAGTRSETVELAGQIGFPVVLKGEGMAHKTEAGAVQINLASGTAVRNAARRMPGKSFLVEEMITDSVGELLIGVIRDPAHGFLLTLAAGGILTELLADRQSLLVPASRKDITEALGRLKISRVLNGYRGKPAAAGDKIVEAILAVQNFVLENLDKVEEVEINPLLCGPSRSVAADALIRMEIKK